MRQALDLAVIAADTGHLKAVRPNRSFEVAGLLAAALTYNYSDVPRNSLEFLDSFLDLL